MIVSPPKVHTYTTKDECPHITFSLRTSIQPLNLAAAANDDVSEVECLLKEHLEISKSASKLAVENSHVEIAILECLEVVKETNQNFHVAA